MEQNSVGAGSAPQQGPAGQESWTRSGGRMRLPLVNPTNREVMHRLIDNTQHPSVDPQVQEVAHEIVNALADKAAGRGILLGLATYLAVTQDDQTADYYQALEATLTAAVLDMMLSGELREV